MIYEVLTFEPTEAVLANAAATLAPAIKFFTYTEGFHGLYFGPCEEEKNTAFIVIAWESYENFKALTALPGFPEVTGLSGAMKAGPTVVNVPFKESPEAALSAGSTEVLVATLNPGKTTQDFEVIANVLLAQLADEPVCIKPVALGETIEEAGKFVFIVGWTSTKEHHEAVEKANQVEVNALISAFKEVVDFKLVHAPFTKYA